MLADEKSDVEEVSRSIALDVISIGNLNIDLIGKLDRMPKPDEKSLLSEFARRPGGGAANFSVASAKMGLRSELVAKIGNGRFGVELMEKLAGFDVGRSSVGKADCMTGFAFVFSTEEREKFLIEHRGANSSLRPSDVGENLLERARLLHGSSLRPKMAMKVGKKAKKRGLVTSLDLGAELSKTRSAELFRILKQYDICFMNRGTFIGIFDEKPTERTLEKHFPSGLKVLAVTLGSEGAIVTNGNSTEKSPKFDIEVESTTGAGDVFAAGFDRCFLSGQGLKDSVDYASAAASLKVRNGGSWDGCPSDTEVLDFMKSRSLD